MKKIILLIIFLLISCQSSFAGLNSSPSEIEHKKKKALSWHNTNVQSNNKSAAKEKQFLKDRALRWHEKNSTAFSGKIDHSKKRAFRWYDTNNK